MKTIFNITSMLILISLLLYAQWRGLINTCTNYHLPMNEYTGNDHNAFWGRTLYINIGHEIFWDITVRIRCEHKAKINNNICIIKQKLNWGEEYTFYIAKCIVVHNDNFIWTNSECRSLNNIIQMCTYEWNEQSNAILANK